MVNGRWGRALAALSLAAVIVLTPGVRAQEPGPQLTPQLVPAFEALRTVLDLLGPAGADLGAALGELSSQLDGLGSGLGDSMSSAAGPVVSQLTDLLGQIGEALHGGSTELAEALGELETVARSAAEALNGAADAVDEQITSQEPQLRELGGALAPVLGQLCSLETAITLVSAFVGYTYAIDGVFVALDEACASAGDDEGDGDPPIDFTPVAHEAGALADEAFATLGPHEELFRPLANPVCVAMGPVFVVAVLGSGALPIPLPLGSAVAPVSVVCAFGEGPDLLQGVLVATVSLAGAVAPSVDQAAGLTGALAPITDLLSPLIDPTVGPACELGPLSELVGAIAVPFDLPIRPLAVASTAVAPLCTLAVSPGPDGGGLVPLPPAGDGPSTLDPAPVPAGTETFVVELEPPPGVAGTVAAPPQAVGTTAPGDDPAASAVWLAILAGILVVLAAGASIVPADRAVYRILRIVG